MRLTGTLPAALRSGLLVFIVFFSDYSLGGRVFLILCGTCSVSGAPEASPGIKAYGTNLKQGAFSYFKQSGGFEC